METLKKKGLYELFLSGNNAFIFLSVLTNLWDIIVVYYVPGSLASFVIFDQQ